MYNLGKLFINFKQQVQVLSQQIYLYIYIHNNFYLDWSIAFSHDGCYIATGCNDNTISLIDVQSKNILH